MIKFSDLFAGIGGMRLGFEKAGGSCIFTCENNLDAMNTYNLNFKENLKSHVFLHLAVGPALLVSQSTADEIAHEFNVPGSSDNNSHALAGLNLGGLGIKKLLQMHITSISKNLEFPFVHHDCYAFRLYGCFDLQL